MSTSPAQRSQLTQLIRDHLFAAKAKLCLAAGCLLGVTIVQLLAPWPLKIILDYILLGHPIPSSLSLLEQWLAQDTGIALFAVSSFIAFLAILGGGLLYFQIYTTTKIGHELVYLLRRELFAHLQQLSLSFHSHARTGEILTKFSGDTNTLKDAFTDWTLKTAAHLLLFLGMFSIMFMLNWELSLIVLIALPLLAWTLIVLNKTIRTSVRIQRRQEGKITSRINETLSSMALVRAFGREEYEEERLDEESVHNLKAGIQTARTTATVTTAVTLISAVATATVVFFGARQVLHGHMYPGDLLIFVAYVRSVFKPIRDLGKLSARFAKASVSAARVAEIFAIERTMRDIPQARMAAHLAGEIIFEHVTFGYEVGRPVLHDASFHIHPGQRVALVGASGAGKSTIVGLLLRLYDVQQGIIQVDGFNITQYQQESLRQEIGLVLQDTVLFGASIEENIAYGKPDATVGDVETAARQAHAHDFIVSLPDGYNTIIGDRGCTLSGGQRQRICLARALIKHPSILVLDEPTSSVDPISASLIYDAIAKVQEGKTTLFISHQFSSMHQFDQILVLQHGRIVEHGPHKDLLDRKGHYYSLYRRQIA